MVGIRFSQERQIFLLISSLCFCRRLQEEEQQFRTSSLPAIPNPFPELCSPTSSPVLTPGSLPQSQPAIKHVSNEQFHVTDIFYKLMVDYFKFQFERQKEKHKKY